MSIGFWQLGILILLFFPSLIALILCLILIKKRNYKKIPKNKIYAGFWHRFLAYLIDFIILAVIYFVLALIPVIGWIIGIFFGWLYFAIQHSSSKRSTLGMRALDITINDENLDKNWILESNWKLFSRWYFCYNPIHWSYYDRFYLKKARVTQFGFKNNSFKRQITY